MDVQELQHLDVRLCHVVPLVLLVVAVEDAVGVLDDPPVGLPSRQRVLGDGRSRLAQSLDPSRVVTGQSRRCVRRRQ